MSKQDMNRGTIRVIRRPEGVFVVIGPKEMAIIYSAIDQSIESYFQRQSAVEKIRGLVHRAVAEPLSRMYRVFSGGARSHSAEVLHVGFNTASRARFSFPASVFVESDDSKRESSATIQ